MHRRKITFEGIGPDGLLDNIVGRNRHMSNTAHTMICSDTFRTSPKGYSGDTYIVRVSELGLVGEQWPLEEILKKFETDGHTLCPHDLAPLIFPRMCERELGNGSVVVAMKPIESKHLAPHIFSLERRLDCPIKLWLGGISPSDDLYPDQRLLAFKPFNQ